MQKWLEQMVNDEEGVVVLQDEEQLLVEKNHLILFVFMSVISVTNKMQHKMELKWNTPTKYKHTPVHTVSVGG